MTRWDRLLADVDGRAMGRSVAQATYEAQTLCALVLCLVLCFGGRQVSPSVWLLLASEALGQLLLVADGLLSSDAQVVYFRRTQCGRAALVAFLVTSLCRFTLAYSWSGYAPWTAVGAAALLSLHVLPLISRAVRPDAAVGTAIVGSAILLGIVLASRGELLAAGSQFAYAAVLVVGVIRLTPVQAERLNIFVFPMSVLCVDVH